MSRSKDKYASFVDHPRYGRRPYITGLNPETVYGGDTHLHWHSPKECRIPNTAIPADLSRQVAATVAVTHYFDVIRTCRACGKSFIFFAEEQKHWYEEIGFGLDSDCVRCVPCRKRQQGIARTRERYEELFHVHNRSADENLEMADCCLTLIEQSAFHRRQTERVRMLLKQAVHDRDYRTDARYIDLLSRLRAVEGRDGEQGNSPERLAGSDLSG
jgi:hypothetical protein